MRNRWNDEKTVSKRLIKAIHLFFNVQDTTSGFGCLVNYRKWEGLRVDHFLFASHRFFSSEDMFVLE